MSRNNVRDKKNLIITIIVIVLIAAVRDYFYFLHYMILEVPIVQAQTKQRR